MAEGVGLWIGHNWLGYDYPVLNRLINFEYADIDAHSHDTLIISKLENYSRVGKHSLETYGNELGLPKLDFKDFSKWSQELEDYCVRDVEVTERVYLSLSRYINQPSNRSAILLEHRFQLVCNSLHDNGFGFNTSRANTLLGRVEEELAKIDIEIQEVFKPREVLVREFTPRETKFGTINKTSVPRSLWDRLHEYEVGKTYRHTRFDDFNPSSHKQIIEVLREAGWSPVDKTKTHSETERELNRLKYNNKRTPELDLRLEKLYTDYSRLQVYGWKINENNLSTLPPGAPPPARALAKRILLEARRRTLVEWLGLVQEDGRIHGRFQGIGAWTHRMAHQNPNTANIPKEFNLDGKTKKLLGKEFRALWQAPKNRLLVGVDAEGIQLRIFAHLIDDAEFTKALAEGKKEDKSDPHSLNQRILGTHCKSRDAAKRFIYALLLGAGIGKLAEILGCSDADAQSALDGLMGRYAGFTILKESTIPADAKRGWFLGLDGRRICIPRDTIGQRKHLAMSGYLQSGEAIVMKLATLKLLREIENDENLGTLLRQRASVANSRREGPITSGKIKLVNFVHDEWQTETPNDMAVAIRVAQIKSDALRVVGEELGLRCPLAGSYYNEDVRDYTIGTNWATTH